MGLTFLFAVNAAKIGHCVPFPPLGGRPGARVSLIWEKRVPAPPFLFPFFAPPNVYYD